jgi:hypothetical protein
MELDHPRKNEPGPRDPSRGQDSARAWDAFRLELFAPTGEAPRASDPERERREALRDVAALRAGRIAPEDINPRVAARWLQIFGPLTLRALLELPEPDTRDADG